MYYALPPIIAPIFTVQVVSSQSACSRGDPTNFCRPMMGQPCQAGRSSVQEACWQSYREYEEGNAHPKHLHRSPKSSSARNTTSKRIHPIGQEQRWSELFLHPEETTAARHIQITYHCPCTLQARDRPAEDYRSLQLDHDAVTLRLQGCHDQI